MNWGPWRVHRHGQPGGAAAVRGAGRHLDSDPGGPPGVPRRSAPRRQGRSRDHHRRRGRHGLRRVHGRRQQSRHRQQRGIAPGATADTTTAAAPVRADLPLLVDGEVTRAADGSVRLVRRFHPTADVFLDDHRIDDAAVLPFAVAMEVMAETALAGATAGESVRALRDVRLFAGVTLDEDGTTLEILATPTDGPRSDGSRTVAVSVKAAGQPRDHYRALVDLSAAPATATRDGHLPAAAPGTRRGLPHPGRSADCHRASIAITSSTGRHSRASGRCRRWNPAGAQALLQPSRPQDCLRGGDPSDWLLDPVVVDSALQLQLVWSRLHWELTLLPLELAELTVTTSPTPRHGSDPPRHARPRRQRAAAVPGRPRLPRRVRRGAADDARHGRGRQRRAQPDRGPGAGGRRTMSPASNPTPSPAFNGDGIAVIGLSCMFPGAPNVSAFWRNILGKVDAVTEPPEDGWDTDVYWDPTVRRPRQGVRPQGRLPRLVREIRPSRARHPAGVRGRRARPVAGVAARAGRDGRRRLHRPA